VFSKRTVLPLPPRRNWSLKRESGRGGESKKKENLADEPKEEADKPAKKSEKTPEDEEKQRAELRKLTVAVENARLKVKSIQEIIDEQLSADVDGDDGRRNA